jgi:hypothetical protein
MRKLLPALAILAFAAWAANIKLYLKDGTYQVVREYQIQTDRIHFYSLERSDWEDIPLDLVDVKRTESEAAARKSKLDEDAKTIAAEEKAERDVKREVSRIPQDPGVYWVEAGKTMVLKQAESTIHTSKGRSILARLTPVPMIEGKGTLELQGAHSANVFADPEQEFYIQLAEPERYGIAKLAVKGNLRIVETLTFNTMTKETTEEPEMMPILRLQMAEDLYKIWPKEKLPPGEYAIIEFTAGKMNMQVWDFAIKGK